MPAPDLSESPVSEGALPPKPRRRVSGLADAAAGAVPHGIVRTRTVPTNTSRALRRLRDEAGAATAEYVIATMAAVGFAGLLILITGAKEKSFYAGRCADNLARRTTSTMSMRSAVHNLSS
ncbi:MULTISPECIES: DUF4244 domain-containing protein [unclassified Cryobacterium]|uniref:DUF4244 domain-containing protein n=1 Tax=unclassified Cryobacterium TaxID=2649013 RepID=UPI002AB3E7A5|nr:MULTISPECIES: DUF4244 domain-containing protein [unclassified Cryobacterium]MDY7542581.1 DUF4244 domain-containing protein [Cryobacterium sp. 5B3]MEB0264701.1 DUF4244 domain-containing protein [Cryobacterium sp. 10I5]MEB0273673.1 DUF4244 domain-containing protein [Cryobacterium sp. 5B3]